LFAAVWPPEAVLDHLDLALGAVRRAVPGGGPGPVRWSARETWHLTCAFYGDVPDGRVPPLEEGLAGLAAVTVPYRLRLRGAGVFSHRTLWAGVGGDVDAQQRLAQAAAAAGEAAGARRDDRPRDRAHLTIGRVGDAGRRAAAGARGRRDRESGATGPVAPEALVGALAVYEGPEWTVEAVLLVASRPGAGRGGGPLYTTVATFPLLGGGTGPEGDRPGVAPWSP
jgi:2'-5' RNA ligase